MISDKIENLNRYAAAIPALGAVAGFLAKNDAASLAPGRHEVADGVFVNVEEYAPGDNSLFEAHREYIDLQYLVAGDEEIDVINLGDGVPEKEYSPEIDASFCRESADAPIAKLFVFAGSFAIFEPRDAHRPGMKYRADHVKKLIFKIKVTE